MKTNRTLTAAGIGAAAAAAMTTAALPVTASAANKHHGTAAKKHHGTKSRAKQYAGKNERTPFGSVQVTITVKNKKIQTLAISASPDTQNSYQLEAYALPLMRKEALKASSYKIHMVSGVTITSEGFLASLYSAMSHAHIL